MHSIKDAYMGLQLIIVLLVPHVTCYPSDNVWCRCKADGCGGLLRPHVVWFGESLETDVLDKTNDELSTCDICLVVCLKHFTYSKGVLNGAVVSRQNCWLRGREVQIPTFIQGFACTLFCVHAVFMFCIHVLMFRVHQCSVFINVLVFIIVLCSSIFLCALVYLTK